MALQVGIEGDMADLKHREGDLAGAPDLARTWVSAAANTHIDAIASSEQVESLVSEKMRQFK